VSVREPIFAGAGTARECARVHDLKRGGKSKSMPHRLQQAIERRASGDVMLRKIARYMISSPTRVWLGRQRP
jgi:hypothetical protein